MSCKKVDKECLPCVNSRSPAHPALPRNPSDSNDVIGEVEEAIQGTDCTFNAFVVEAVRVALENLREED